MVVAVPVVGVMEMAVDEVVDMVAVRDRLVPAALAVHVVGAVTVARVAARAGGGMVAVDRDDVFVDVILVGMVEMAVVEVVDVAVVLDGDVAAARAVLVRMTGVDRVIAHVAIFAPRRGSS